MARGIFCTSNSGNSSSDHQTRCCMAYSLKVARDPVAHRGDADRKDQQTGLPETRRAGRARSTNTNGHRTCRNLPIEDRPDQVHVPESPASRSRCPPGHGSSACRSTSLQVSPYDLFQPDPRLRDCHPGASASTTARPDGPTRHGRGSALRCSWVGWLLRSSAGFASRTSSSPRRLEDCPDGDEVPSQGRGTDGLLLPGSLHLGQLAAAAFRESSSIRLVCCIGWSPRDSFNSFTMPGIVILHPFRPCSRAGTALRTPGRSDPRPGPDRGQRRCRRGSHTSAPR